MTKPLGQVVQPTGQSGIYWSIKRYHLAIESGVLTEEDRVELIEGKIIEKMPKGLPHNACMNRMSKYFNHKYLGTYEIMSERPITVGTNSEPEPDFTIAELREDEYLSGNPTQEDIHLVVEVADSSLGYDRSTKASLYAAGNLQEFWIVNLPYRMVELHTKPNITAAHYSSVLTFTEDQTFQSPFCGPVRVADLLPDSPPDTENS